MLIHRELKRMETISGGRTSGQVVVAQAVRKSDQNREAGRWIIFDNGAWDFKIDNDRMGRAADSPELEFNKSKNATNATLTEAWLRRQRTKTKAEKLLTTGGANSENCEQEKGNVCGDDLAVDNRENKEGKVEEGGAVKTASDNLPQQICLIEDTRTLSVEQVSVENGNNG
ncbi:hypothetical protein Bca52824_048592 [Brassica carinata]|uniref:Uncharacterized protein n=1 Tax=Brassica carinata TaxID=52824 RepID=A0A8X7RJB2_BRACI|nr:hypothetical protein Bca52824_048592 [Brassica carinata]